MAVQKKSMMTAALALAAIAAAGLFLLPAETPAPAPEPAAGAALLVEVTVPELDPAGERGKQAFDARCAACHGPNGAGLDGKGPPLIHPIYEPGHHGDQAMELAAMNGARAHHWPFGDMPPVEGITRAEILDIIGYIRAVQRANGIN